MDRGRMRNEFTREEENNALPFHEEGNKGLLHKTFISENKTLVNSKNCGKHNYFNSLCHRQNVHVHDQNFLTVKVLGNNVQD